MTPFDSRLLPPPDDHDLDEDDLDEDDEEVEEEEEDEDEEERWEVLRGKAPLRLTSRP